MTTPHSLHIPVMGIGFTIDTPLKVSQYGIDSALSLSDDILLERLRKMYCSKYKIQFEEITSKMEDFRAKRITSYLNLLNELAIKQFDRFKKMALEKESILKEYLKMLPSRSKIVEDYNSFMETLPDVEEIRSWINEKLSMGSIDVNIMTKVDRDTFIKNEKQPATHNDAHAALRGYATSDLTSSVIFSAGMNPRLYSYMEQFEDFYPNENGEIKKKIVLKVSDYRSAFIQGRFLAKKGLWVSEYRIESGLNCGGHAFATGGDLLGPILAEFRDKREELIQTIHEVYIDALANGNRVHPANILPLKITAQGGVGTHEEHQFLLDHYNLDSVGWGSPFLLVPEATTVDHPTLGMLTEAKEEDLYLSDISPLGVQFNNLRGTSKDIEKRALADQNKPGSPCVKKYLAFDKEFSEQGLCTASRKYQNLKIKQLKGAELSPEDYQKRYDEVVEKECICTGLGSPALLMNDLDTKVEGSGVSVCPGPNIAYFSKVMTLKNITDHIYGRVNMISRTDRPNMFIKELGMYVDYLKTSIAKSHTPLTISENKYLTSFAVNLNSGIDYYQNLFSSMNDKFNDVKADVLLELERSRATIKNLGIEIRNLAIK